MPETNKLIVQCTINLNEVVEDLLEKLRQKLEVEAKEVEGMDKAEAEELGSKADDQKKNALNIRRLEEADLRGEADETRGEAMSALESERITEEL